MPNKSTAALIGIALGFIGAHYIYLKKYNIAVVWFLFFVFTSWTGVMPILLWFIGACQGISYLFYSPENWEKFLQK